MFTLAQRLPALRSSASMNAGLIEEQSHTVPNAGGRIGYVWRVNLEVLGHANNPQDVSNRFVRVQLRSECVRLRLDTRRPRLWPDVVSCFFATGESGSLRQLLARIDMRRRSEAEPRWYKTLTPLPGF